MSRRDWAAAPTAAIAPRRPGPGPREGSDAPGIPIPAHGQREREGGERASERAGITSPSPTPSTRGAAAAVAAAIAQAVAGTVAPPAGAGTQASALPRRRPLLPSKGQPRPVPFALLVFVFPLAGRSSEATAKLLLTGGFRRPAASRIRGGELL